MQIMDLKKIGDVEFEAERDESKGMTTNVVAYTTDSMLEKIKTDRTLQQAVNASSLPGIVGNVLLMPDAHEGYGFPVGGVVAFDADEGIICPGSIGFDINCGVRLIKTNLTETEVKPKLNTLLDALFKNVPSGVGSRLKTGFSQSDLERTAIEGVGFALEKGYGVREDLGRTEENGAMEGADFSKVSKEARTRGVDELGTLGAGNHFLEVQKVDDVLDGGIAKAYGLFKGQVVVMVHCGSRGFGHQICSDYLRSLVGYQAEERHRAVDRELATRG